MRFISSWSTQGTDNGGQKNLGLCEKQLLRRTLLLTTMFCSALGSFRRPNTSPSNVMAHSPILLQIQLWVKGSGRQV